MPAVCVVFVIFFHLRHVRNSCNACNSSDVCVYEFLVRNARLHAKRYQSHFRLTRALVSCENGRVYVLVWQIKEVFLGDRWSEASGNGSCSVEPLRSAT